MGSMVTKVSQCVQAVNHGIPEELLERVKKGCIECHKMEREEGFKRSTPAKLLTELLEERNEGMESVDWEDAFTLFDNTEWPIGTPGFKCAQSLFSRIEPRSDLYTNALKSALDRGITPRRTRHCSDICELSGSEM